MKNFDNIKNQRDLPALWTAISKEKGDGPVPTLNFYGHAKGSEFGFFSNFFKHEEFDFELPDFLKSDRFRSPIPMAFTEKAIMLCKAALFKDKVRYDLIIQENNPLKCKGLGRKVVPWDQDKWNANVVQIAESVVYQKFSKVPGLKEKLLATGDKLIAETTARDKNWAIGLNLNDPNRDKPAMWRGVNILGYALMKARNKLGESKISKDDSIQISSKKRNF